jgi:GTP-binding protein HflX
MRSSQSVDNRERVLLVGVGLKKTPRGRTNNPGAVGRDSLNELEELAISAGAKISGTLLQVRDALDPATLVGRGKLDEIRAEAEAQNVPLVIVDHDLTPVQLRNMERGIGTRVIDRTQLILDIFAVHARTREGQLQVELAQLNYLLPRLTGRNEQLSRLGGGIGTRGPGEQKLETDRRRIRDRVAKIKDAIETVRRQRTTRRRARQAVPLGMIALVGYTNAGKSTLFNRLAEARVLTDARMFATLDPTVRSVTLPSRRRALMSDTVGFIRSLPTTLVEAFRATLEEVTEATLILHVVDVSSPHAFPQTGHVLKVLSEIGAAAIPQLLVLNKMDLLPEADVEAARRRLLGDSEIDGTRAVAVSALTGFGIDGLLATIDEVLVFDPVVRTRLRFPLSEGARISQVHELGRVLEARYAADSCEMDAEIPASLRRRLDALLVKDA